MTQSRRVLGKKRHPGGDLRKEYRLPSGELRLGEEGGRWVDSWRTVNVVLVDSQGCLHLALFPYTLPRHPGSSERQVNSWLEGREAKGPVWNGPGWTLLRAEGAEGGITPSSENKVLLAPVWSCHFPLRWNILLRRGRHQILRRLPSGTEKTPTSYKNTFLGWRIWFQLMSHPCFLFFFKPLSQKWGFLKSISWSKIFHCLGFSRLTERHPEWLFPQARSCLSLHERHRGTKFVTIKFQAHQEKATWTQYLWSRSEKWPRNRKYILKPTFQ